MSVPDSREKGRAGIRPPFSVTRMPASTPVPFFSPSLASSSAFPVSALSRCNLHPPRLLPPSFSLCHPHGLPPMASFPLFMASLPAVSIPAPSLRLCSAACGRLRFFRFTFLPAFPRVSRTAHRLLARASARIPTACRATASQAFASAAHSRTYAYRHPYSGRLPLPASVQRAAHCYPCSTARVRMGVADVGTPCRCADCAQLLCGGQFLLSCGRLPRRRVSAALSPLTLLSLHVSVCAFHARGSAAMSSSLREGRRPLFLVVILA